jgi:hypothetical protein
MLMRRSRLLFILIALLVVEPSYKIYQQGGIRNNHSTLAAELPVASSPSSMEVIKSPKKRVDVRAQYGIATIEGRWKKVNPDMHLFTTPTINTVKILCGHEERRCTETIAFVYFKSLDGDRYGGFQDGELGVISHEYEIREWSEDLILAVKIMPVATLEIRIFPKTQTVDRIYAEREDPSVFNRYVLE